MRVISWFSCGAASAVASKLTIKKYGHNDVHIVYCDTLSSEHPDNIRFLNDIKNWLNHDIELIKSEEFNDIDEVFTKTRYMSGINGARCTIEMKKKPRYEYQNPGDIHIFGLTSDEEKRIERFKNNNPNLKIDFILSHNNITKNECYKILRESGIKLPVMYSLGFNNNNCIGCVKSTSAKYWNRVRRYFPEIFNKRCQQSRDINVRLVRYRGERIFLDQLPNEETDEIEENIECGVICIVEREG